MRFVDRDVATLLPAMLSDDELVRAQRELAQARHTIEASEALVAAEIGRRSRRELGYEGLAQRHGARSAEQLVQRLSGSSHGEACRLVRVGTLVDTAASEEPWLRRRSRSMSPRSTSMRSRVGRAQRATTSTSTPSRSMRKNAEPSATCD